MQVGFICPNGAKATFEECLKKCPMGERCISKPTLKKMSKIRPWTGTPSTTQLLNGTRHSLLTITQDYYEDPQALAFALLGTKFHGSLEDSEFMMEEKHKSKNMTGTYDFYSPEEKTLWDYKTSGGFKIKKALGLVSKKIRDPSGARYKTSGRGYKKGDIKLINEWHQDEKEKDCWEWELQLNRYRLWLEDDGHIVNHMKIEATIRDGGTQVARTYGLDKKIYVIPIKKLPREYVLDFYNRKAKALRLATAINWAPICDSIQTWNGLRCEKYCPVAKVCQNMPNAHSMENKFNLPKLHK